jgi:hypothetical protein
MCGDIAEKGCMLWMEDFCNMPSLAQRLKSLNTDCVVTLRLNIKYIPKTVIDNKLNEGELIAHHSGPFSILKWSDRPEVTVIST